MPPLQTNATLTRVAQKGTAPDWDLPGAAGAEKWAGAERCYYRETRERVINERVTGTIGTPQLQRTLIVGMDDGALEHIDTNDVLTFTVDGGAAQTGTALIIPRVRLAGLSARLQTARIELDPTPAGDA